MGNEGCGDLFSEEIFRGDFVEVDNIRGGYGVFGLEDDGDFYFKVFF